MNIKLLFLVALLPLLASCSSANARGYIKGQAGVQAYNGDTPVTSPYEIDGHVKFKVQSTKPILTIEVLDPATVIRTQVAETRGRLEGAGVADNGNTLIIRK